MKARTENVTMAAKYFIFFSSSHLGPTCDVTIFVKGTQNAQFSFRIFSQDFLDFESSYLWNGSRYQQTVKSFLFRLLTVFHISQ